MDIYTLGSGGSGTSSDKEDNNKKPPAEHLTEWSATPSTRFKLEKVEGKPYATRSSTTDRTEAWAQQHSKTTRVKAGDWLAVQGATNTSAQSASAPSTSASIEHETSTWNGGSNLGDLTNLDTEILNEALAEQPEPEPEPAEPPLSLGLIWVRNLKRLP